MQVSEMVASHIPNRTYDHVEQWLGNTSRVTSNGISVPQETVMVDPRGTSHWVHEGDSMKYQTTKNRGRVLQARAVDHVIDVVEQQVVKSEHDHMTYMPSFAVLSAKDRYLTRQSEGRRRWDSKAPLKEGVAPDYRMPVVQKLMEEGRFGGEKDIGTLRREKVDARHRVDDRVFSKSDTLAEDGKIF